MSIIRKVSALLAAGVWAAAVAVGQPQRAREKAVAAGAFGPDYQEVHIGAAAFQHLNNISAYEIDWTVDGYLSYTDEAFLGVFAAPLDLPAGAEILTICTYFHDSAPVGKVTTYLDAVKMADEDTGPAVVPVWGPIENDIDTGYGGACNASGYTFRQWGDVDGDGSEEDLVHRIRVEMTETGDGRLALGGVNVIWRRQVSPPPSSPSFADVPMDHPFFQWIEALKKSSITAGCSETNFCPNAPLTRGQMAVFLAKALGLHWPY
jgi:hypothetical protein